jgi:hypothetical protein
MMNYSDGILLFESVIDNLKTDLESYAKIPNAKLEYIKKQNSIIAKLCTAYNALDCMKFSDIWAHIEFDIARLEKLDPVLSGHRIFLRTKPTGDQFSLILYNPFE